MATKISSLDVGYVTGNLSVFPDAIDDKTTLYEAKNNANTVLKQSLSYSGKYIIVDDASNFPSDGLLKLGPPPGTAGEGELIYYAKRTSSVFSDIIRGFAGSRQNQWTAGTSISSSVMAEHHNSIKDAVINIENRLGTSVSPTEESLNGILKKLEIIHLAPKAIFRTYPLAGPPPLTVRFQNFSSGNIIRNLWDFGDGSTSIEKNPTHIYTTEGVYSVKLNVITSTGAQGFTTKSNYITVSNKKSASFFYVKQIGITNEYTFVDQTQGEIKQRYWVFGDGSTETVLDPNIHSINHTYTAGTYSPTLIVIYEDQSFKRVFLPQEIIVS